MIELAQLREAAIDIFRAALGAVDARAAVRRVVHLRGTRLSICETDINPASRAVYAIAIGKAAHAMAAEIDSILGERISAGVLAGPPVERHERGRDASADGEVEADADGEAKADADVETDADDEADADAFAVSSLSGRWRVFAGGHPLPNEESLAAAYAAFEIMRRAEEERALVLFLISGGGSALLEWPRDERITLADLREANRTLVTSGASIGEINAVRRAISAVKGGGLAALAPHAAQLSLIISDTNIGEESNVASGPTFAHVPDAPSATEVVARYELALRLPSSILRAIAQQAPAIKAASEDESLRKHCVLITNEDAVAAAERAARARGFLVEVAGDIVEQEIGSGCAQLFERLIAHQRAVSTGQVSCLLSGGEFACPVRTQSGRGGRNSETALRLALEIAAQRAERRHGALMAEAHIVALSAGTDGIDGNSPAAGALADETTLERAGALGLSARQSLQMSDAYTFFQALGDSLMTGPTGTNVRDLRILLAG